ncbi:MAG: ABC transporter ATP-binding protein [Candidatus Pacebacteria bacterium]|nr:ABC transporter ATP-binding protein [Candidatus Paceibacterota bacterium]
MSKSTLAPALQINDLIRTFINLDNSIEVLRGVNLTIKAGESVALVAPSGSGKSTLLHLAGLLERPTSGEVMIDGEATSSQNDGERTSIRGGKIGFIYQFHHLLPGFSALENIVLPQLIRGVSESAARNRARELLDQLGLAARADHRPARLSGGEQQRVAIARALANRPSLILADEPTGNLDAATASQVTATLLARVKDSGVAALIATHNIEMAAAADRILMLREGIIIDAKIQDGKLIAKP